VVENAADYRDQLIKEGLEVSPLVSPNSSVQFFFVKDPNGVQIQFVENK
jgi:lactoylglutathione lyase